MQPNTPTETTCFVGHSLLVLPNNVVLVGGSDIALLGITNRHGPQCVARIIGTMFSEQFVFGPRQSVHTESMHGTAVSSMCFIPPLVSHSLAASSSNGIGDIIVHIATTPYALKKESALRVYRLCVISQHTLFTFERLPLTDGVLGSNVEKMVIQMTQTHNAVSVQSCLYDPIQDSIIVAGNVGLNPDTNDGSYGFWFRVARDDAIGIAPSMHSLGMLTPYSSDIRAIVPFTNHVILAGFVQHNRPLNTRSCLLALL
jgi:hypothetical protein